MISKELLSEVLNLDIIDINIHKNGSTYDFWYNSGKSNIQRIENLYELAHKCKEWAYAKGVIVRSYRINDSQWTAIHYKNDLAYYAPTEPKAIFKACQWLLENKER